MAVYFGSKCTQKVNTKRGKVKSEIKILGAQRGGRIGCKSGNHLLCMVVARGISSDRIYLKPTLKLFWPQSR